MLEYKVTRDVSMKNDNNPQALEKVANEMAAEGWRLAAVAENTAGSTSKLFMFWERAKA